jgi:hypothetical protein
MTSIITSVGSPGSIGPTSGGKVTAFNAISTVPGQVLGANQFRVQALFHNPGGQDIFIYPINVLNASGQNTPLAPTTAALGGCFRVFANGGTLTLTGECQGAWGAFAAANANNPLTVMDTNA